jgi:hypothetical protein
MRRVCTGLIWLRSETSGGILWLGYESSDSITSWEFHEVARNWWILKDWTPWNWHWIIMRFRDVIVFWNVTLCILVACIGMLRAGSALKVPQQTARRHIPEHSNLHSHGSDYDLKPELNIFAVVTSYKRYLAPTGPISHVGKPLELTCPTAT